VTSQTEQGGRTTHALVVRRLYEAACWTLLVATAAAACVGIVLLAGTVLHAVVPG